MPIRSLRLLLAAALLAAALPAPPLSARAEAPFQVERFDNGLTILLAPSDAHPVIALSAFVTTGGRTEDEYYQGALHFIEHLVFRGGSPTLAPTEFRKRIAALGREAGCWTWDDEINFGFETPKENFAEALHVHREALLDLEFEEQRFHEEKQVVLQEMSQYFEEPAQLVEYAWNRLAFEVHPYRRPVVGAEKPIRELALEDIERYYRERFTPNHVILVVAGDFERDEMLELIRTEWGEREPGPASFELGLVEPPQRGPRTRTEYLPQATDCRLVTGFVTPGGDHTDVPALTLLAALMNEASFGLPQFLEHQESWVSSVGAEFYVMKDYGTFRVRARTAPENADAVTAFTNAFILAFDVQQIPSEIFEETRLRLLAEEAQSRATFADLAERVGLLVSRRGVDAAATLLDDLAALTPASVQAAKERWLGERRLVTVTVYPEDFTPARATSRRVEPGAPAAPPLPDLDVPGALQPPDAAPLTYDLSDSADGVSAFTYANGLRLLVLPTAASPLLAVCGRVLGGQWVEPQGEEGSNRFVAELGLEGTRRWERAGFDRLLGAIAASASAHISVGSVANTSRNVDYRDSAAHHYLGMAQQWHELLATLKETLFFPSFAPDAVKRVRSELLAEVRSLPEHTLEYTKQEFYNRAFAGHPYGRPTPGTQSSLAAVTPQTLAAFHRRNWTPAHTTVAVVGDVVAAEVADWISTHWADLSQQQAEPFFPSAAAASLASWNPPPDPIALDLGKETWGAHWGRPGVTYGDERFFPSLVLSRLARNDHFYKYVYGEGVSYRSWITFWPTLGPGAWILENDLERDRYDEILAMFDEDLARYSIQGFGEEEFAAAARRLVNSRILDDQNSAIVAWNLAIAEGNGVGFRRATRWVDALEAVPHEDVQALAAEVFVPEGILRINQK